MIREFLVNRRARRISREEVLWSKEKLLCNREKTLKEERSTFHKPLFKISTTKLLMAFIFINCTIVEAYSMWIMYKLMDISALYTLITAVVGETIAFAIYSVKSTRENTAGGIVYESAMKKIAPPTNDDNSQAVG